MTKRKCKWPGCSASTERPHANGWAYLANWGPGVPDRYYCHDHTAALEAVEEEGGLDVPENDLL